jgi:hypothetical protein
LLLLTAVAAILAGPTLLPGPAVAARPSLLAAGRRVRPALPAIAAGAAVVALPPIAACASLCHDSLLKGPDQTESTAEV